MPDLKITLVQTDLSWEKKKANLENFSKKLNSLDGPTDLVLFPEMFTTGFTMNAAPLAESMDGQTVEWMKKEAASREVPLAASFIASEKGSYYNRFLWVSPEGDVYTYDKKHLFTMAGEDEVYTPGKERTLIEYKGWKIAPFICYDLRFPLWLRNRDNYYDLALFVANWPEKRSHHWRTLLRARAIENQAFVAGVNRVGRDGNGLTYRGDSSLIDPMGKIEFEKEHHQCIQTVLLKRRVLEVYRDQFPVWKDANL